MPSYAFRRPHSGGFDLPDASGRGDPSRACRVLVGRGRVREDPGPDVVRP